MTIKKTTAALAISLCFASASTANGNKITIFGVVTDKNGNTVEKCDVFFNKEAWIADDSVHVTCDENGRYTAEIDPGHYNSFYVCDEEKYGKTALEFWGWNLTLDQSQAIDVAFDTLEVYSLATWASNGGSSSLFASFRPMSLAKPSFYKKEINGKSVAVLDITPAVDATSIIADIDGASLELLNYQWTYEKMNTCGGFPDEMVSENGCYMPMIIAQFKKPKLVEGQHTLKVRLRDYKNGNIGEGITHFVSNRVSLGF